jgi:hypothetical protein
MTRITGSLHEDVFTFKIIPRLILLRMRYVLDKIVDKIWTQVMFSNIFSKNRAVYERMSKSLVEPERPQQMPI